MVRRDLTTTDTGAVVLGEPKIIFAREEMKHFDLTQLDTHSGKLYSLEFNKEITVFESV